MIYKKGVSVNEKKNYNQKDTQKKILFIAFFMVCERRVINKEKKNYYQKLTQKKL